MSEQNPQPNNGEQNGRQTTTHDLRREADEALKLYAALHSSRGNPNNNPETGTFAVGMLLRVEIQGSDTPVLISPEKDIIIGRTDPASGVAPELDLSPYAAYQMGISRRHAIIRQQGEQLHLLDLGSRNGTYVNGKRVTPHEPFKLHDGDEMRLGKMSLRLFFRRKNE